MLRKLAGFPRQNSVARALREIGRIERTLFMLDWFDDPDQRRRTGSILNKGEARNALARAIFFNRLGELRDRTFENQRHRASGLTLVTAAMTLWNTVYLDRAVRHLRGSGVDVPDEAIAGIADDLRERRDLLVEGLRSVGFTVGVPEAGYFVVADAAAWGPDGLAVCRALPEQAGVAAVPVSAFLDDKTFGATLVRFAFCKRPEVIKEGVARLHKALKPAHRLPPRPPPPLQQRWNAIR